jgi:hypothetical protein
VRENLLDNLHYNKTKRWRASMKKRERVPKKIMGVLVHNGAVTYKGNRATPPTEKWAECIGFVLAWADQVGHPDPFRLAEKLTPVLRFAA